MTIRMKHLTITPTNDCWLHARGEGQIDVTNDESFHVDLLGIVRHVMRERSCDIVPVVNRAVASPVNKWGHNFQVEVTYDKRGHRAIYGVYLTGDGVVKFACYMD